LKYSTTIPSLEFVGALEVPFSYFCQVGSKFDIWKILGNERKDLPRQSHVNSVAWHSFTGPWPT
jgi:hypothetical protein